MFYAGIDKNKNEFQIKNPQQEQQGTPVQSNRKQSASDKQKPSNVKPPKVLKDAGSKALNYPQITHDILDQQTANLILKDLPIGQPSQQFDAVEALLNQHKMQNQSPIRSSQKDSGNSKDLNSAMARRLADVEKLSQNQKLELKEKYQIIEQLREKVQELTEINRKLGSGDKQAYMNEINSLKEENQKKQKKIEDMEKFLQKYGVKWVGDKISDEDDKKMKQMASDMKQMKPLFNYHLPKEISIDVIKRRIEELNYIMEKDGANQIVKNANGMHQFQKMEPLPIGFYKNGIAMKGYKFFSYGSNDAYQILADILEGYFPYQLKQQYPNGTPLKLIDKTEEVYEAKADDKKQCGYEDLAEKQLKPMKKEEFLEQLPECVIKNGKIIPIRSDIEKRLSGQPNLNATQQLRSAGCRQDPIDGNWIVDTEAQRRIDNGEDLEDVCTLKFRTETGKYSLIALMFGNQRICDMYQIVSGLKEYQDRNIQIILNFPRTVFQKDDQTTLEEAGLMPSAQLFFNLI
ncbi:unnamed protein product [Paramecium primaurelia]|uniref:UBX domain-containing protein 11 n=2 Tax=Paramecium TaxID=5884 RepID=A0A8S1VZK5_9CILI|nr:unnamed protein product [Paramecium primaurelia]CAD8181262.1 unnamed protein product [Paramecium pentaurelia]